MMAHLPHLMAFMNLKLDEARRRSCAPSEAKAWGLVGEATGAVKELSVEETATVRTMAHLVRAAGVGTAAAVRERLLLEPF